jgi:hypothetical protein
MLPSSDIDAHKDGSFKGRLHGAFLMCVSMSGKPFVAKACNIGMRQKSKPITLDATLCPALMCNIVFVFDERFRWRFHVAQAQAQERDGGMTAAVSCQAVAARGEK